jgi:hypothetical protein
VSQVQKRFYCPICQQTEDASRGFAHVRKHSFWRVIRTAWGLDSFGTALIIVVSLIVWIFVAAIAYELLG